MKHCLIVDDSAVVRKVAKRIVESMSVRTTEAEDGAEALHACRRDMPDVVLVDWVMPVMDGFDFLRGLRQLPGGTHPKVVFVTVENDVAAVARAIHAGADDHVLKPFDRETLASKLHEVGLP